MASKPRRFTVGIQLSPDTTSYVLANAGEMKVDATLLKIYLDGAIRTLVSTDQTQTLTNKTVVVASNTITTTASGNLAATELNAALAELQGDIDSRATASDLTNHISDTTTHGTTGNIVGTSDSQTLTNKTLVVASNTVTTAASGNLAATELNAALAELQADIDTRLTSGALTAHESDTSTHGVTEIVGTSESQTLTNKTIVVVSNTVTTAASGNLAATELNAALAELQGDIDGRATSGDLSTHISDTTTHGTTGNIVGTSDTQVLTNKDIDGGTASNTSRITLPKAAKATLDALTRKEATLVYATDTDKVYYDDGSTLTAVGAGGGAGSPDLIFNVDADDYVDTSTFVTGDGTIVNGSALPGGTLQGTFVRNTTTPVEGSADWLYTQAAGSLDSYIFSDAKTIDPGFRGKDVGVNIVAKYDGADNDIVWIVWDETNDNILTTSDFFVKSSTVYKNYQTVFTIPSTCTSIRVGLQVKVLNSGKILEWDMMALYDRPFVMANIEDNHNFVLTATAGLKAGGYFGYNTLTRERGAGVLFNELTSGNQKITALRPCYGSASCIINTNPSATNGIIEHYDSANTLLHQAYFGENDTGSYATGSYDFKMDTGDYLKVYSSSSHNTGGGESFSISATAQVESIITQQAGDDSAIHLTGAGGFGSTNTKIARFGTLVSSLGSGVTYADSATLGASFTIVEAGVYCIGFTSRPQAGGGAVWGISKNSTQLTTDYTNISVATQMAVAQRGDYGSGENTASATSFLNVGDVIRAHGDGNTASSGASGVSFFITKVGYKSLSAAPIDRVCYVKQTATSGTGGGSTGASTYTTRAINSITGDTSFASVSSSQLTLQPGTYDIDFEGTVYSVNNFKGRIYSITDSAYVTELDGKGGIVGVLSPDTGKSRGGGRLVIVSPKIYEWREWTTNAAGPFGLGYPVSQGTEVHAIMTIKKVK